jgi:hypothetical protein
MAGYAATRQSGAPAGLGWLSIVRLGLVQASLGSIVVLTTSVLNRVMVVELMLAAVIPGPACRPALRGADIAAAVGTRVRPRRAAHTLDRWRHSVACVVGHRGLCHDAAVRRAFLAGHGACDRLFCPDRTWHRRCGNLAAGLAGKPHRTSPQACCRNHRLDDDDRRHRRHRHHFRRLA